MFSGFSQEKFEREFRISKEEVPQKAQNFIKQCEFDKKVKWYMEESQDGKAIEAKSYKKNYKYSVEFDMKGNVLELAIAVIMAGAFGMVVSSFTNDVIMPVAGYFLGGTDFSDLKIVLKEA